MPEITPPGPAEDGTLTLFARARFRRVAWDDVRPGDVVYYYFTLDGTPRNASGPLTIVDPAARTVVNTSGVPVTGLVVAALLVRLPDEPTESRFPAIASTGASE
jgi:hypothetical protein